MVAVLWWMVAVLSSLGNLFFQVLVPVVWLAWTLSTNMVASVFEYCKVPMAEGFHSA